VKRHFDELKSTTGQAIVGASVQVNIAGTGTKASLFNDAAGTQAISNPLTTNSDGEYSFYAANGRYDLVLSANGFTGETLFDTVLMFDPQDFTITPQMLGALGNGVSDDYTAVQTAVSACVVSGATLELTALHYISQKVVASKPISIRGRGFANTGFTTTDLNDAALEIQSNGPTSQYKISVSEFGIRAKVTTGTLVGTDLTPNTSSAGILISGDGTNFLQRSVFRDLKFQGQYAGIKVTKGTRTTGNGQENNVDWCVFDNIQGEGFTYQMKYLFWWTQGSGTGNTYDNIRAQVHSTGVVAQFDGSGCVVGDILISATSVNASAAGAAAIGIGDGTVYRNNIAMVCSQVDANVTIPFVVGTGAIVPSNIRVVGTNIGGSADLWGNLPVVQKSVLWDRDVSDMRALVNKTGLPTGANAVNICSLQIGSNFTGALIEISVTGLNGGVASGGAYYKFYVVSASGTLTASTVQSFITPGFGFTVTAGTSGMTATFTVNFTSSATGSNFDAQIRVSGQACRLLKL